MTHRRLLPTVASSALLLALAVGCSDDSSDSDSGAGSGTSAAVTTLPDDGSSDTTSADTTAPDTGALAASGSCDVTITGDLETQFTSLTSDGGTSIAYRPWRIAAGVEIAPDTLDGHLAINCWSGEYYIAINSWVPAADGTEPFSATPATYTVYDGFCGGNWCANPPVDSIAFTGFMVGTDTWLALSNGELVITEFDDQHIVGSFTVPLSTADAATMQQPGDKRAQLTVEFEFDNPY